MFEYGGISNFQKIETKEILAEACMLREKTSGDEFIRAKNAGRP
jgi:hypothetical protein